MRRLVAPALALAAVSCARDLALPSSSPPRIDSVRLLGLESGTAPVPLPVLGGELVVVRGSGFLGTQVEVHVGTLDAVTVSATQDRLVVRVPALGTAGTVDLQVRSPAGFATKTGALRYDGDGKPLGLGTSELPTSVPLGFVAPVQPPGATGFPDLAVAIGASDSALLVVPSVGFAVTTIPLGLVPGSAAARWVKVTPGDPNSDTLIEVLALARGGEASLGTARISSSTSVASRVAAKPLASMVSTAACTFPQVMFTNGGIPVAAWVTAAGLQRIAAIDMAATGAGAQYTPVAGGAHTVPAGVIGWAPWKANSVVFAAGNELYVYDASTPTTAPSPLQVAVGGTGILQPVSGLLATGCTTITSFLTIAAATSGGSDALAVSYRAGDGDRVALVVPDTATAPGTVHRGLAGTIATSLALVPEPPFGAPPQWAVLAAGITNLYRFRPLANAGACQNLVPDAVLPLSSTSGVLPTFGGMITAADGTRLLATTPEFDLVTVLPPSLTSAGPVLRVASYGGLSMQRANLGGGETPVAVAEHASSETGLSSLDTGSALLVVSLAGDRGSVALGGSGFGRGAVWLNASPAAGALAFTGDLPASGAALFSRGGAAAVTGFSPGSCPGEDVRITGSRPVTVGRPDLMVQGPARSGALGPDGIARWGPGSPPVYAVRGTSLDPYATDAATLACLVAGADWGLCTAGAPVDLGVEPLDVTVSAGDLTAAVRSLETDPAQCTQAAGFPAPALCLTDSLCLRASCPPAKSLQLVRAGAAPVAVTFPARPSGVAADRAGGFLVTLPCAAAAGTAGGACFPGDPLCAGFTTGPGGADGALVLVAEDGSAVQCLAVQPGLGGPLALTPNGEEAWVTGTAFGSQILTRLTLSRRSSDGTLDTSVPAKRASVEALGASAKATGAFPPGGIGFTPDGGTGIVTVPGQFRILLYQ